MTFALFWDEAGTPIYVSMGIHLMLELEEPVFLLSLAKWEGRLGADVTLLGLFNPPHYLSEHYLAKLTIISSPGAFPDPATDLFFQVMLKSLPKW